MAGTQILVEMHQQVEDGIKEVNFSTPLQLFNKILQDLAKDL